MKQYLKKHDILHRSLKNEIGSTNRNIFAIVFCLLLTPNVFIERSHRNWTRHNWTACQTERHLTAKWLRLNALIARRLCTHTYTHPCTYTCIQVWAHENRQSSSSHLRHIGFVIIYTAWTQQAYRVSVIQRLTHNSTSNNSFHFCCCSE